MTFEDSEFMRIKEYLLGRLPDPDAERIEERIFKEGDFSEWVEAVEDELIDEYVFERLSNTDQKAFEERFLPVHSRRRKVQIARLMKERSQGGRTRSGPGFRPDWTALLKAAAVMAMALALGILFMENSSLQRELAEARNPGNLPQTSQGSQPSPSESSPLPTLAFGAPAGREGSGEIPTALIGSGDPLFRVRLPLPEEATCPCRVQLFTVDGDEMMAWRRLPAVRQAGPPEITLDVATRHLRAGDFYFDVSEEDGGAYVASHTFRLSFR